MKLPDDMVMEVLVKLPVKSLVRFSCVCKTWHTLIFQNPYFREKHLNNLNSKKGDPASVIMKGDGCKNLLFIHSPNNEAFPVVSRISDLGGCDNWRLLSCNGILCSIGSSSSDPIYLFNPITRERPLELPPLAGYSDCIIENFGFGFDAFKKDYKVIVIRRKSLKYHAHIYKLSTRSWSTLDVKEQYSCYLSGVYAKGFYYWIVYHKTLDKFKILKFDFEKDIFKEIILEVPVEYICETISVVDDSLAVCAFGNRENREVGVWVMDKEETWTKKFSVTLLPNMSDVITFWIYNKDLVIVGYDRLDRRSLMDIFPNDKERTISSDIISVHITSPAACIFRPTLVSLRN